jgi:hypothetical protein
MGASPVSVVRVQLEPLDKEQLPGPGGNFSFSELLPGEYELVFSTRSGPIARLKLRVFAFRTSRVDLEIGEDIDNMGGRATSSEAADWGHVEKSAPASEQLPRLTFGKPHLGHVRTGVE